MYNILSFLRAILLAIVLISHETVSKRKEIERKQEQVFKQKALSLDNRANTVLMLSKSVSALVIVIYFLLKQESRECKINNCNNNLTYTDLGVSSLFHIKYTRIKNFVVYKLGYSEGRTRMS